MNLAPKEILPGDCVSWSFIAKQMEDITPENWSSDYIQLGEAVSTISGKLAFDTFIYKNGQWIYIGECYTNEKCAPEVELPINEILDTLRCVENHFPKTFDKELEAHIYASITCIKAYRNFIMSKKFVDE